MLKIGDFSRLAQVSTKTLRYYADLGLFRPAWTDRFTGYRYYTLEQLPRLNRILALKDLGFSLEQIRQLLREDLPASELRGMLRMKYAELQQQVRIEQERLVRVEARLQQIEHEGRLRGAEVLIKRIESLIVVGIRRVVPDYGRVGDLFEELRSVLQAQGRTVDESWPCLAIYYDAEHQDRRVDVEVAVPMVPALAGLSQITVHELPRVETMACLAHEGSPATLNEAYGALGTWMESHGYRGAGPYREVYLQGPLSGVEPSRYVTEVHFPVEKAVPKFIAQQEKNTEPKIVSKPAFTVVGLRYQGKNQNEEIGEMWGIFNARYREIPHKSGNCYGICTMLEGVPEEEFEYVAGVEVDTLADLPEGMVARTLPAQKYAVFPCTLQNLHEAYEYVYQTWLPGSGYRTAGTSDFEFYDENFDVSVDDSPFYIYVPII